MSKSFPHESTADQWFSESQFESYRKLGETLAYALGSSEENYCPGTLEHFFDDIRASNINATNSEYRRRAERCRALARAMLPGAERDQLLEMATTWEQLAEGAV